MRQILASALLLAAATGATVGPDAGKSPVHPATASEAGNIAAGNIAAVDARLIAATRDQNTESARAALEGGASLECTATDGATPLSIAAEVGSDELVDLYLSKGAKVNTRDQAGWTPLIHASVQGWRDVTRLLLAHGARADIADYDGFTALMQASARGYLGVAKPLIEHGAQTGPRNVGGLSALHFAAAEGHLPLVKLLLASKADPNLATGTGQTPLMLAALKGRTGVVEALTRAGAKIDARARDGQTALMYAAATGRTYTVGALLADGADASAADADGKTALDHAVAEKRDDVASMLAILRSVKPAEDGAAAEAESAPRPGNSTLVESLIEKGADVNAKSDDGKTALIFAAGKGRDDFAGCSTAARRSTRPTPPARRRCRPPPRKGTATWSTSCAARGRHVEGRPVAASAGAARRQRPLVESA
jgi:ankyrin repeat protein